jgi:hypothetical protein
MLRLPELGNISPVKHLKQVVLPAPETPNRAKHSPYSSPNDMFFTAGTLPKNF